MPDVFAGALVLVGVLSLMPTSFSSSPNVALTALAVYAIVTGLAMACWPADRREFGWPNRITLMRASVVAALAGALMHPAAVAEHGQILAAMALFVIFLDGVDGWLARMTQAESKFGARFDMEVDALLILVLSAAIALSGKVGPWIIAIGLMRYVFVLAGQYWPALAAPLCPSFTRKTICVLQGFVLIACLLPIVSTQWATALAAVSLLALVISFGRDGIELLHRSHPNGAS